MPRTTEYTAEKTYNVMRRQRTLRLMGVAQELGRNWILPDDVIDASFENLEDDRAVEARLRGEEGAVRPL